MRTFNRGSKSPLSFFFLFVISVIVISFAARSSAQRRPTGSAINVQGNCGNRRPSQSSVRVSARAKAGLSRPSVAGGKESQPNSWPWMVAIFLQRGSSRRLLCGGSVINNRYVLTAAHCFTDRPVRPSNYIVITGAHNITRTSIDGQTFRVAEVKIHENHRIGVHYNDVALVRLARQLSFSDKIAPVCLPFNNWNAQTGTLAIVTGWGDLSYGGPSSRNLQEVRVPVVSREECNANYSRIAQSTFPRGIDDTLLCAGYKMGGKDACQGDSGGPLVMSPEFDIWYQIGIVSFGYGCAAPGFPGVYTKVTAFSTWIARNSRV